MKMKTATQIFELMEESGCRQINFHRNPKTNMKAILVVDSLPSDEQNQASGGTRFAHNDADIALHDAINLARAMTRKVKVLGVAEGGAKAVVIADQLKTKVLLESVGEFIEIQKGLFKTAIDLGFNLDDAKVISSRTKFIDSLTHLQKGLGSTGENTAEGMVNGLEVVCNRLLDKKLDECSVAIQGLGAVGGSLAKKLLKRKCRVIGTDFNKTLTDKFRKMGVKIVPPTEIFNQEVDIFSPCALGGVLDTKNISKLNCRIVASGANNPLRDEKSGDKQLFEKGIIFIPEFVLNSAGFLQALIEREGGTIKEAREKSKIVAQKIGEVINHSQKNKLTLLGSAIQLFGDKR